MQNTANYQLKKYEGGDSPNLITGYNASMDAIDSALKAVSDKVDAIPVQPDMPDGLAAFFSALGITADNATHVGEVLARLVNKTPATDSAYSVSKLAKSQTTEDGLIFVPDSTN